MSLFKIEISSELLSEVITTLDTCWLSFAGAVEAEDGGHQGLQEAKFALDVLNALTSKHRLGNASKF